VLMCSRRIIPFCHSIYQGKNFSCDLINESIGLVISLLMLLGIIGIGRIFSERKKVEQALREFDRLKMSALQGKANPHFLFNTLNSIAFLLAENKKSEAETAVHKLADINRYLVDLADGDLISLEKGLQILQAYFDLEQLRFGNKVQMNISIDGDATKIYLPGLTLQPIVENSIKHGFGPRGGMGTVDISLRVEDKKARITIHDNGVGCADIEHAPGHGIRIVMARLKLCFKEQCSMGMKSKVGNGTTTIITVPLIDSPE
jgi:LytS/YehU family sensor histidine kinase